MRFDAGSKKVERTALYETAPADFHDAEVVREFAVSKDGTRVPINIIRRKGTKLDGTNPVVLYGYGGYGINMSPYFSLRLRALLDRGVVYAIANLRGGGEYGEAWHHAGMLTKKQNVFDDFAAAARHLIERRYTTSARLAIEGGSNGGLLMGAAMSYVLVPDTDLTTRLLLKVAARGGPAMTRLGMRYMARSPSTMKKLSIKSGS